ncbi:MAG: sugar dehydratase, partial [Candidatus Levybacteria bacterium CG10_big_fil_rev_8_21_14_0_10_36_7]
KILITGATGFIGGALANELGEKDAHIFATYNKKLPPKNNYTYIKGDVSSVEFVFALFQKHSFDYCFHLAAQPLVDIAEKNPLPTFKSNIEGTWNVLEASRKSKIKGIIVASTSHVYGENDLPFIEDFFPKPTRPYETSKACADMIAQTYANYYRLPVAIARCSNIYGPGDTNKRLIPRTVLRILNGKNPEIYQSQTTRDYMYIADAVSAYITLAEKINLIDPARNVVFNFGTGNHYTNAAVVKKILDQMGKPYKNSYIVNTGRNQEINKQYVSI